MKQRPNIEQNVKARQFNFSHHLLVMLLMLLLAMQSFLTMADSCITKLDSANSASDSLSFSNTNYKNVNEQHLQVNTRITEHTDIKALDITDDDCIDCDGTCCPCCSNVTFTLASIETNQPTDFLMVLSTEFNQFEPPYYAFLRPPKQIKHNNS